MFDFIYVLYVYCLLTIFFSIIINIGRYYIINNNNNIEIVMACQECFSFELPSEQLAKRVVKFKSKLKRVTV